MMRFKYLLQLNSLFKISKQVLLGVFLIVFGGLITLRARANQVKPSEEDFRQYVQSEIYGKIFNGSGSISFNAFYHAFIGAYNLGQYNGNLLILDLSRETKVEKRLALISIKSMSYVAIPGGGGQGSSNGRFANFGAAPSNPNKASYLGFMKARGSCQSKTKSVFVKKGNPREVLFVRGLGKLQGQLIKGRRVRGHDGNDHTGHIALHNIYFCNENKCSGSYGCIIYPDKYKNSFCRTVQAADPLFYTHYDGYSEPASAYNNMKSEVVKDIMNGDFKKNISDAVLHLSENPTVSLPQKGQAGMETAGSSIGSGMGLNPQSLSGVLGEFEEKRKREEESDEDENSEWHKRKLRRDRENRVIGNSEDLLVVLEEEDEKDENGLSTTRIK